MTVLAIGLYGRIKIEPGYHEDGQLRAFKQLGIPCIPFDVESISDADAIHKLSKLIRKHQPDIILIDHKKGLKIWSDIKKSIKLDSCISVYWMCDGRKVEGVKSPYFTKVKEPIMAPSDLKGLVDFIFISDAYRIDEYRVGFETDNVYWMPQACTPKFMHKIATTEIYDMTFAGSIAETLVHEGRENIIKSVSSVCKVNVIDNKKIDTPKIYSQSKLVLGMSNFNYYLTTSNRFFVGMGCGACMMFPYFPGIDLLVENKRHLVWWHDIDELKANIKYYLRNNDERKEIQKNAEILAHEKHTYVNRIQNMLDIIDNKTKDFYGFI